jgi:hypothetical protein|tara:strand:- start:410 stop:598 length:189 start_codon:yes stop_codon:yes gene_type:complete
VRNANRVSPLKKMSGLSNPLSPLKMGVLLDSVESEEMSLNSSNSSTKDQSNSYLQNLEIEKP